MVELFVVVVLAAGGGGAGGVAVVVLDVVLVLVPSLLVVWLESVVPWIGGGAGGGLVVWVDVEVSVVDDCASAAPDVIASAVAPRRRYLIILGYPLKVQEYCRCRFSQ